MPRHAHTLITWKGVFGSVATPLEEWQFSLRSTVQLPVPGTGAAPANTLFAAAQTHLMALMPPSVILRTVDVRHMGMDGKQSRDAGGAFTGTSVSTTTPFAGTGTATPLLPPQCAVVVSLVTARAGARGKGRFFLPAPAGAIGTDYRLTPLQQENLALGAKAFLAAVNTSYGTVSVVSSDGAVPSHVTALRVGRAIDTQRRRRGDLLESYRTEAL